MPRPRDPNQPPLLEFRLRNTSPVAVADYSAALRGLEDEYRQFAHGEDGQALSADVALCISRLRTGSIVAELFALAPLALPFVEHANTIVDFASHLKTTYSYLLGKVDCERPPTTRTLQNVIAMSEPVAKDGGSILNINTVVHGDVHIHLKLPSKDANAAQNVARKAIAPPTDSQNAVRERVLLYLYQARGDLRSKSGDKAIIESISPSPVRVEFLNENVKRDVVAVHDNPFRMAFVVDVEVGTVNGKPLLYKVLAVHASMERPEAA